MIFEKGADADSLGDFVTYDDQQDSAIWTGTYLAAQAFRYAATTDPIEKQEALHNARKAAQTLHLFLKVTGHTGLIARFAGPLAEVQTYLSGITPCEGSKLDPANLCCKGKWSCQEGTWQDRDLFWLGNTTRDQYSGWFFGMGIAYRLIDDPELRQLIGPDIQEVVTQLQQHHWTILGPDRLPTATTAAKIEPLMQAAWLLLAAEVAGESTRHDYCQDYEKLVRDPLRRDLLLAEDDFDWTNRYMQYYGFNLSFLAFYNLIQLEPQEARRRAYLKVLEDHVYKEVKGSGNSFFDYIALAVGAQAPEGTLERARLSLEQLQELPGTWSCVLPPKSEISKASIELYEISKELDPVHPMVRPQAEQPYPLKSWCSQDFVWQQSPYEICCCQVPTGQQWSKYQSACDCTQLQVEPTQTKVYPRVDYLVAYWMGRYHGFLKPES